MKITVKNNSSERQSPEVTIDTSTCHYPYAIREALELALRLDGYGESTIKVVFNRQKDTLCPPEPNPQLKEAAAAAQQVEAQGHFTNDYGAAFEFLVCNGVYVDVINKDKEQAVKEVIQKANELWEQQNKQPI